MVLKNRYIKDLSSPRFGMHYFPDSLHYTNQDLATWLPRLKDLRARWLVLLSDASRAIPEQFITTVIQSGITPIVHIPLALPNTPSADELKPILSAYSRWGVKYIILFDKPNESANWSGAGWVQQDLVERFIDHFLPLAALVVHLGMIPLFPPLQPGGDYWDLTFLKQALISMQRRGQLNLVKQMGIASYGYTFNHEIDWGSGGVEKWPKALPYFTSENSEDQRGFYNHEWLKQVAKSAVNLDLPVVILGAGVREPANAYSPTVHAGVCQEILERLSGTSEKGTIPDDVICCNFHLLSADVGTPDAAHAWFRSPEDVLPIVDLIAPEIHRAETATIVEASKEYQASDSVPQVDPLPIEHYLLLPIYEWGVAEFHLEVIRPYVQKYHPTIGFSLQEAGLAKKVTILGGEQTFPEEDLAALRNRGCVVERVSVDGTSIATQLEER